MNKEYDLLAKKHRLLPYQTMQDWFDIDEIEPPLDPVKIRRKIHEKLDFFAGIVEQILQPESNLRSLYESHYLEDEDKKELYALLKSLMYFIRYSNRMAIINDAKKTAIFIRESCTSYKQMIPILDKHLQKLMVLWQKKTKFDKDVSYFG